jgi:hypothetical protein
LPTLDIRQLGVRYATKNGTVDALSGVDRRCATANS